MKFPMALLILESPYPEETFLPSSSSGQLLCPSSADHLSTFRHILIGLSNVAVGCWVYRGP